jgi:hypothetical protein
MSTPSEYTGQPVIIDLPRPFQGFAKASVVNIDVLNRVIHFQLVDAEDQPRQEINTALFEGTFTNEAIAADIINDLEAHA